MKFFSIITFAENNQLSVSRECFDGMLYATSMGTTYIHLFSIRFNGFYGNKKKTKLSEPNPVSQTTAALLNCDLQKM